MTRSAIAIVGAGNVGTALARAFTAKGESVVFGVTHPGRHEKVVSALGPAARVASSADAVAGSELVILATPYPAALGVAQSIANWQDRILVDATNPLAPGLAGLSLCRPSPSLLWSLRDVGRIFISMTVAGRVMDSRCSG